MQRSKASDQTASVDLRKHFVDLISVKKVQGSPRQQAILKWTRQLFLFSKFNLGK